MYAFCLTKTCGSDKQPLVAECNMDSSLCAIPIQHRLCATPNTEHYKSYGHWAVGDKMLDWHVAEPGQGNFEGRNAGGSPTVWTTNNQNNDAAYHKLNKHVSIIVHATFVRIKLMIVIIIIYPG